MTGIAGVVRPLFTTDTEVHKRKFYSKQHKVLIRSQFFSLLWCRSSNIHPIFRYQSYAL